MPVRDAETGSLVEVDSSSARVRDAYRERVAAIDSDRRRLFGELGIDEIRVTVGTDWVPELLAVLQAASGGGWMRRVLLAIAAVVAGSCPRPPSHSLAMARGSSRARPPSGSSPSWSDRSSRRGRDGRGGPGRTRVERAQVVRIESANTTTTGSTTTHLLRLAAAPFSVGDVRFTPAVNIISGATVEARTLPAVRMTVLSSLAPGDPLELSPLTPPRAIGGAESPLLKPAIGLGAVVTLAAVVAGVALLARFVRRRLAAGRPIPEDAPPPPAGIEGAEVSCTTTPWPPIVRSRR